MFINNINNNVSHLVILVTIFNEAFYQTPSHGKNDLQKLVLYLNFGIEEQSQGT